MKHYEIYLLMHLDLHRIDKCQSCFVKKYFCMHKTRRFRDKTADVPKDTDGYQFIMIMKINLANFCLQL